MNKRTNILCMIIGLLILFSIPVYAGSWQGDYEIGWRYIKDNNQKATNEWVWIPLTNNPSFEHCYYFDDNGFLLTNTTTPDGYNVTIDGSWYTDIGIMERLVHVDLINYEINPYKYRLHVLENMDSEDYIALSSVCYNEVIRAGWDGEKNIMPIEVTVAVIETVVNRINDPEWGCKTKISKVCNQSGQFVRYPTHYDSVEFQQALAMTKENYANNKSVLPNLKFRWFSSDDKARIHPDRVKPYESVWVGLYREDGSPRKGLGQYYRCKF